jgi:hypothetical protein
MRAKALALIAGRAQLLPVLDLLATAIPLLVLSSIIASLLLVSIASDEWLAQRWPLRAIAEPEL